MIKNLISFLILIFVFQMANAQNEIRLMTYNLRYDNPGDGINQWKNRIGKIDSLLSKYHPDILGIQEGLVNQLADLKKMKALNGFEIVGVGRDDGKTAGEYSAICYNSKNFKLISSGTFWLSPTPDSVASKGWDAALTRICTFAKLKQIPSGKEIVVFNTHFDHVGETARFESAKLIVEKIHSLAGSLPVILMGDFNSEPTQRGYQAIMSNTLHPLYDTHETSSKKIISDDCTFKGFQVNSSICKRIDFIFTDQSFTSSLYQIIDDNDGTYFPSDHKAVLSVVQPVK